MTDEPVEAEVATAAPDTGHEAPAVSAGRRYLHIALVASAVIIADQVTKTWATNLGGRTVDVIGSLRFKLAFNTGMAFSRAQGMGRFITLAALVIVGFMVWLSRSHSSRFARLAIGLVIGGALGNLIDRVFRSGPYGMPRGFLGGAVVDFIDLQWWPVFNIADAAVVVGGVAVALLVARDDAASP